MADPFDLPPRLLFGSDIRRLVDPLTLGSHTTARQGAMPPQRILLITVVVATIGWIGVVAIGAQLASISSAALGHDLELLLQAGRDIAAGRSPYAPELVGGTAPTATELFYSYPPPVAQVMSIVAGLPSTLALVLWGALAVGGLLAVAEALRRRLAPDRPRAVVLAICAAAAPLTLPFSVGLLFGNFDVFFPLLYGTMLLAALDGRRRAQVMGGIGLAVASLKLHPASLGLWFLVRGFRDRAASAGLVVVVTAIVVGAGIVVVSLLLDRIGLWSQYAQVVRAGTSAVIVDPRNAGIAAVAAGAIGDGDALARSLHLGVAVAALALTIWAGWRRGDVVEGFAWAAAASLSTLPVTWYHYPSAMIPVAIAAWLRADQASGGRVRLAIVAAMVVGAVAIAVLPLLWIAIGLVILAARWSRPASAPVEAAVQPELAPAGG
jgi:Glycosyltransferase family 87